MFHTYIVCLSSRTDDYGVYRGSTLLFRGGLIACHKFRQRRNRV